MSGIDIHADGQLRPDSEKMQMLLIETEDFCNFKKWSRRQLESILGKWAWVLILQRPLFSVLAKIYKVKASTPEIVEPTARARQEFRLLISLAPMIQTDLALPFSDLVIATDACNYGGAVVYRIVLREESLELHKTSNAKKYLGLNQKLRKLLLSTNGEHTNI